MKTFLSLMFILLLPFPAGAHPGKTDYRGGHRCWKNCGEWELRHAEYHLHDKDWNPIRLDAKGDVIETVRPGSVPTPEKRFLLEEPAAAQEIQKTPEGNGASRAIVEKHHIVTVYEESLLPHNYILLLLMALLMLLILIFVRKKKEKE
jgi:LPXTG-motif cell wall-anchored protein